eukprot:gb/GECG01016773.1/.p1 GENE.gb/GECG01016773.1/~~gb/GECG01016773.1/.p1  ORF type:complete len:405 (+),score=40.36 gb/GECG01016773.1/:1-1215(+)
MVDDENIPSPHSIHVGQTIATVVGFASVLGATVIIGAYITTSWGSWRIRGQATAVKKIKAILEGYMLQLFWLSVADWLSGLTYGISRFAIADDFQTVDTICRVQTVGIAFFPVASLFWTTFLAMELHRFIVYPHWDLKGNFSRKRYYWYHVVAWGVPLVMVLIVAPIMGSNNAGIWCWFREPAGGLHATFYVIYLTSALLWLFIVALYVHMGWRVRKEVKQQGRTPSDHIRNMLLALLLYPLVFLVIFIFQLLNRIGVGTTGKNRAFASQGVAYATAATAPAQGFLNCIVYLSTNRKVRKLICNRYHASPDRVRRKLLKTSRARGTVSEGPGMVLYDAGEIMAKAEEQGKLDFEGSPHDGSTAKEDNGVSLNTLNGDTDDFDDDFQYYIDQERGSDTDDEDFDT